MGLPKSMMKGIEDHRQKIGAPHFIFSAEAPKYPDKNSVNMNHQQVLSHLRGAGYDAHGVEGHYGGPERSIVVYGVNPKQAENLHGLAARLGQDSSIYSNGSQHEMLFHHGKDAGKKIKGTGTVWHQSKPADFYTSLPGGQHHFTHNFNFDEAPTNPANTNVVNLPAPQKKVVGKSEGMAKSESFDNEDTKPLLNRIEDKYLVLREHFGKLVESLRTNLKKGDSDTFVRYNRNETIYFDTPDLDCFKDAMEGIRPRFKMRIRRYCPNGETWEEHAYLELKIKDKDGVTRKMRVRIGPEDIALVRAGGELQVTDRLAELNVDIGRDHLWKRLAAINSAMFQSKLRYQLTVQYDRRAYSNDEIRVTVDENLRYFEAEPIQESAKNSIVLSTKWKKFSKHYGDFKEHDYLIVEVKRQGETPDWLKGLLADCGAEEDRFSKYCASIYAQLINLGKPSDNVSRQVKMDVQGVLQHLHKELGMMIEFQKSESDSKICTSAKELVQEHERLVQSLKSSSKQDRKKEAKKQSKELAEYKKEMVKCEKTSWTFIHKAEDPEAYKKLAMKGMMVGFPATIQGQANRPDNGLGYHSTLKLFDPEKDSPNEIHHIAQNLGLKAPDPKETGITPDKFKDRLGNDVYVLKLHGPHADKIKEHNKQFEHMGHKMPYEFTPHVSVDKATWQKIVDSGAKTAHEAGIQFHPAELKQGTNTLATYHENVVPFANKDPNKLAASEKTINDLRKSALKNVARAAAMGAAIASSPAQAPAAPTPPSQVQSGGYNSAKMLRAIEHVESSDGKNTHHEPLGGMHQGEKAYGKYGLTPVVIRETIKMNPDLKHKYQKAMALKGDALSKFMQDNPHLEDVIAQKHLKRLEHHFGQDPNQIGYAWLNGVTGTYKAKKQGLNFADHWHVKKLNQALRGI